MKIRNEFKQGYLDILNVEEAALYLGMNKYSMYRLLKNSDIPFSRLSQRNIRIKKCDLDNYLEKCKSIKNH